MYHVPSVEIGGFSIAMLILIFILIRLDLLRGLVRTNRACLFALVLRTPSPSTSITGATDAVKGGNTSCHAEGEKDRTSLKSFE